MTESTPPRAPQPAHADDEEQSLLPVEVVRRTARATQGPTSQSVETASLDPVARVLLDVPLAHLDRPFDYQVTQKQSDTAVPGARVKVRFAGQEVGGFIVERVAESEHPGKLQPLRRVVSGEPVLSPEIAALSGLVAARYAGTRSDVLRLAVPGRHAGAEKIESTQASPLTRAVRADSWDAYGSDVPTALAAGGSPRVVLAVMPSDDGLALLADAVLATVLSGRGAVVCVPDNRELERLDEALTRVLGKGQHVALSADAGPQKRYSRFLSVSRGAVKVAIGTRAAAFAPVHDLGLVAIWDDGDDLYAEPRAPYCHTREVLLMRAQETGCAAILAAHARSVEGEYLIRTDWAVEVAGAREALRARVRVSATGDSDRDLERDPFARSSRLPREVLEVIKRGLERGPVLVQTPRSGYATRLACDRCRTPATCHACLGPLRIAGAGRAPECAWCATVAADWACPECGGRGLRAPVLGDARTAEELGRALPNVPVRTSSGERIVASVPGKPAIVVATPGAEPVADAGYAAVVLLDTWLLLAREDLRAAEEAVRRWANAASLVTAGGEVLLVGPSDHPALQALIRWDPAGFARREIGERLSAHLPPASRVALVSGAPIDAEAAVTELARPPGTEVLGPVVVDEETVRFVVRAPRVHGAALSEALRQVQALRSARKVPHVRVQIDPMELG